MSFGSSASVGRALACSIRVSTRAFVRIWRIVRKPESVTFFVFNNQHWFESHTLRQHPVSFPRTSRSHNRRMKLGTWTECRSNRDGASGWTRTSGPRPRRPVVIRLIGRRGCQCWRDRPGTVIGPAACTCLQIRRPTLSASAMMLSSSIVRTLRLRMMNWPSTMTDSMSDG